MNQQNLEEYIRNSLADHESSVDTNQLWSDVRPALGGRKPLFWWWGGALALLLVVATLGYVFWDLPDRTATLAAQDEEEQIPLHSPVNTLVEEDIETDPVLSSKAAPTSPITSIQSTTEDDVVISPTARTAQPVKNNSITPDPVTSSTVTQTSKNQEKITAPIASTKPTKQISALPDANISKEMAPAVQPLPKQEQERETISLDSRPLQRIGLEPIEGLALYTSIYRSIPSAVIQPLPQLEKKFQFRIGLESGVYRAFRLLALQDPDPENLYPYDRQETERPFYAASLAVKGEVAHHSGVFVRAGLQYLRINEKFEKTIRAFQIDTIPDGIQEVLINRRGDTTFVLGPVAVQKKLLRTRRTTNQFNIISVPVSLGYAFRYNKLRIAVEGGVLLHLDASYKGAILNPRGGFLDISDRSISPFKKHLGLSYTGGVDVSYRIAPRTEISAGTNFMYFPNSFVADESGLLQRYNVSGGRLKLNFLLR